MSRSTEHRRAQRELSRLSNLLDETTVANVQNTSRLRTHSNISIGSARTSLTSQSFQLQGAESTDERTEEGEYQLIVENVTAEETIFNDDAVINSILREGDDQRYTSDSDSDSETPEIIDIGSKYVSWITKYNISAVAADEFLNYLRENHFHFLPKTIKTLRNKAYICEAPIRTMGDGRFFYFGIKTMLNMFLDIADVNVQLVQNFTIGFGIDGVPVSKSSKSGFWPILARIQGYPSILPVAIFHGPGKPHSVHDYLKEFAAELEDLLKNGMLRNDVQLRFSLGPLVFDAQAKCFVHDLIAPTGFYACPKCITKGRKVNHRMVFPNLQAELRTDESFLDVNDPIHREPRLPPLAEIGINCITDTAIDYMHNSCQGVMKALLNFWTNTTGQPYSLNIEQKQEINKRILLIRKQIVSDFVRKPRPLEELSHYKATEFRQILIYTGPILFIKVLKKQFYDHFMLLNAAHRILCHPNDCIQQNHIAEDYLLQFTNDFKHLYGEQFLVYNFHVISHIAKECLHFRQPLDGFSAFAYENFLQKVVKMTKRAPFPLEQLRNRLQEQFRFRPEQFTTVYQRNNKTMRIPGTDMYDEIFTEHNVHFTTEGNDRYAFKDDRVFEIQQIIKPNRQFVLICKRIEGTRSFHNESITYGLLYSNTMKCSDMLSQIIASECSKALRVQINDVYMFAPLLHSE